MGRLGLAFVASFVATLSDRQRLLFVDYSGWRYYICSYACAMWAVVYATLAACESVCWLRHRCKLAGAIIMSLHARSCAVLGLAVGHDTELPSRCPALDLLDHCHFVLARHSLGAAAKLEFVGARV